MSERTFQAIAVQMEDELDALGFEELTDLERQRKRVEVRERYLQTVVEATWGIARESHREEWSLESHQDPVPDYAYTNIVACTSELLKESKRS